MPRPWSIRKPAALLAVSAMLLLPAGVALAQQLPATATADGDRVRLTVGAVRSDDIASTLSVTVENAGDREILLNQAEGLSLTDADGVRYLLVAPADNPQLAVQPGQVLTGDLVFLGPVSAATSALTLATSVPSDGGGPLAVVVPFGQQGPQDQPFAVADRPDAQTVHLNGRIDAPNGLSLEVPAVRVDGDAVTLDVVVENRSSQAMELNAGNGLTLRDEAGNAFDFSPPTGNEGVVVPANGRLEGRFVFAGRVSPIASGLVLEVPAGGQAISAWLPLPGGGRGPVLSEDGQVALLLRDVRIEGDLVIVDALLANWGGQTAVLNDALGLRLQDDRGRLYPINAAADAPDIAVGAGSAARLELVFVGPLAPDVAALTLLSNAAAPSGDPGRPQFSLDIPVVAPAEGPRLVESSVQVYALPTTSLVVRPLGSGSTARVQQLQTELGARQTDAGTVIALSGDILFDFDSRAIRPDAQPILDQLAELIGLMDPTVITVEGHTDALGHPDYNMALSRDRARAVLDYLSDRGVVGDASVVERGAGETEPVAPNTNSDGSDNPEGRQLNRRVEVTIGTSG